MMSLREVIAWYRALPRANGWLKAGWIVSLVAPFVGVALAVLVGAILNDQRFAADGLRVGSYHGGGVSAAILLALAFLPLPALVKLLIVPVVALIGQAYWGARAIELRDRLLAALVNGASCAIIGLALGEALGPPLPSLGLAISIFAGVGAVAGVVSVQFARRGDPPRKGLAYGL